MEKKLTTRKRRSTRLPKGFPADMKFEVKFTANFNTALSECLREKLTYLLNNDLEMEKFTEATRAYLADLLECHDLKNSLDLVFFSRDFENTTNVPNSD